MSAPLDPNDPRTNAQRIASALRAAIKTGQYEPGDQLPTQIALAEQYDVARETVRRALDLLASERLIVVRKGSGSFVRSPTERPVGLRPYLERAFEVERVVVDFAGFSAETLQGAMSEPLDRIRHGHLSPTSIQVRVLISDMTAPQAIPARADGSDSDDVRARMARITDRAVHGIVDAVTELADLDLVSTATAEVRTHRASPVVKVYILNGTEAFLGFYRPGVRPVTIAGTQVDIIDALGKDSILLPFEQSTDDGALFVEQATAWFEAMWTTLGQPYDL